MSAKSAPQLRPSALHHARSAVLHVRGTLAILGLAVAMSASAWLLERTEPEPLEFTAVAQPESGPSNASSAPDTAATTTPTSNTTKPSRKDSDMHSYYVSF